VDFLLRTFFRHYSLYEYSFKPKVELVLLTIPKEAPRSSKMTHFEEENKDEEDKEEGEEG